MTEEISPKPPRPGQLDEEAATWFARMRGPEAEAHRPAFDAWLARGALHLRAYNRAVEIFSDGKFLDESGDPPFSEEVDTEGPVRRPTRFGWYAFAFIGVCVISLIGWAVLAGPRSPIERSSEQIAVQRKSGSAVLATKVGETRSEKLADGSVLLLRSDTRLKVVIDANHRDLFLERGAAQFDVAHESRPFVVYAGGGSVTARGTLFEVRMRHDEHVVVQLLRGSVDVVLPAENDKAAAIKRLAPGQVVTFGGSQSSSAGESQAATGTLSAEPAKQNDDVREFDRIRLADLVAQVNTTCPVHIRLSDQQLGERTVSGRFRVNDAAKLAYRLAAIFNLSVDRGNPSEIVLTPQ